MIMFGKLTAVGVGPGDPELLTLKAVKRINEADVIACPAKEETTGVAYRIAEQVCPELAGKETLLLDFPMKKEGLAEAHRKAAEEIISVLRTGKDIVFLTLGDPCVYSTFSYVSDIVEENGYEVEIINGIPSFCAVFARLKIPVVLGDESVIITSGEYIDHNGTLIIMKAGGHLKELKEKIDTAGKDIYLVENCGMADEKVYAGIADIPDRSGYFSILIIKDKTKEM